jgi:hypothetical protein
MFINSLELFFFGLSFRTNFFIIPSITMAISYDTIIHSFLSFKYYLQEYCLPLNNATIQLVLESVKA